MTAQDVEIRERAKAFVDSLIPYEVEAEMAGGYLPKELADQHHERAIELGLYATNMPKSAALSTGRCD